MELQQQYFSDQALWAKQVIKPVVAQHKQGREVPGVYIFDIDDMLLDANAAWYRDFRTRALEEGTPQADIATIEVFKTTGPRQHYEKIVANYDAIKAQLMVDPSFNARMAPLGDLAILQHLGKSRGIPHGYLSTRPAVLGRVTCDNLQEHALAPTPVLLRGEHIPYAQTIGYKIASLGIIRAALDAAALSDVPIYHFDDYLGLVDEINQGDAMVVGVHVDGQTPWHEIMRQAGLHTERL